MAKGWLHQLVLHDVRGRSSILEPKGENNSADHRAFHMGAAICAQQKDDTSAKATENGCAVLTDESSAALFDEGHQLDKDLQELLHISHEGQLITIQMCICRTNCNVRQCCADGRSAVIFWSTSW